MEIASKGNRHRSHPCGDWMPANKRGQPGCHPLDRATNVFIRPHRRRFSHDRVCRDSRTIYFETHRRQKALKCKRPDWHRVFTQLQELWARPRNPRIRGAAFQCNSETGTFLPAFHLPCTHPTESILRSFLKENLGGQDLATVRGQIGISKPFQGP